MVVRDKLKALVARLRAELAEPFEARLCVDTAPLLEREWAALAGVGWIGKNTMVLHEGLGSFFMLGSVVTTLDISADEPAADHCGSCTACLDACPTQAFPAPYQMDAARCISYLTIEHRGQAPAEFHGQMSGWLFGCDVCQEVCPFNRKAPPAREPRFTPRAHAPALPLSEVLAWDEAAYRAVVKDTAMTRATREMWQRNAGRAMGQILLGDDFNGTCMVGPRPSDQKT